MEPVTHFMTGACLSRAGLNRQAAYATLAMTLGAEAPDLDTLWALRGPVDGFQHHRGLTHTFLGIPFEALVIVALCWAVHRFRSRRGPIPTAAPVRWPTLWVLTLLALLSHLLLDFTNNYGIRPFFPFNPRWYAGSIVFIFEPVLFLALLAGLVMPSLFGLINSEVGARRPSFRGRGWATAALLATISLWSWRFIERQKALQLAATLDLSATQPPGTGAVPVTRLWADPYPGNPYKWQVIAETQNFYQLGTANTLSGTLDQPTPGDVLFRGATTLSTLAAKRSPLGEAYLDWSMFPLVTESASSPEDTADAKGIQTVVFRDLRFFYDTPFFKSGPTPPLTGTVVIDADRRVVRMQMDGRTEP